MKIKILTEGDSWFHLPFRRNVIDWINKEGNYKIIRLEKSGDELLQIMSGPQKANLRKLLQKNNYEFLLFSGGGNDLLGPSFFEILKYNDPESTGSLWERAIDKKALARRIQLLKLSYEELIYLRDLYCTDMCILTHCYDYIIPSHRPFIFFFYRNGPWILPYLEKKGWHDSSDQRKIIKILIDSFADMLSDLYKNNKKFIFVDTRNTIPDTEWGDEIHPTNDGFKLVAEKFLFYLNYFA